MNKFTQFDYLLNAFEDASQSGSPAELDYRGKRQALFAYVRDLEARASQQVPDTADTARLDWIDANGASITQNARMDDEPPKFRVIGDHAWHDTIRGAIDFAIQDAEKRKKWLARSQLSASGQAAPAGRETTAPE